MPSSTNTPFQPSISSGIATVICIIVCCSLAYWQYGRIQEKLAMVAKYQLTLSTAAANLNTTVNLGAILEKEWQPVSVRGEFLESYQFLLDSQVYQGKPGYHAIVPLKIADSEQVILINRGWIPAGTDRTQIPKIPELSESQPIQGQLARPKTQMPGFEAQNIDEPVQLFINIEAISASIGAPIAPMLIQLDVRAPGPLPREWPEYQAKIEMHEFYVLHWLIAAFISILIYVYFGFKSKR